MAGLATTFHRPCKLHLHPPLNSPSFFHLRTFSFPPNAPNCPSISSVSTAVVARYGTSGGVSSRKPKPDDDDEALNFASIRSDNVRLIDEQQKMVGVVSKSQAFRMAEEAELDLVILSPEADPPVVRIMDYNKYRYEQQKKKRDQQKKSAASRMDLKELKMGYNIDVHDYSVRLKAAHKFLKDGDKVKVIVNLKGRENDFRNNAIELLKRFQNDIGEVAVEEAKNFRDRNMFVILVPNKAVGSKSSQDQPRKKDVPAGDEEEVSSASAAAV